ncbi:MAG: Imm42 family immunity protein [Moraxellaceae bacterium]
MIFGSPDKFAIYLDVVDEWSEFPVYVNGLVALYIKGVRIFGDIYSLSIFDNVSGITKGALRHTRFVDEGFFNQSSVFLIQNLMKNRHPAHVFYSVEEFAEYPDHVYEMEDVSFDANFDALEHYEYKLFVMSYAQLTRILCVKFASNAMGFFNLTDLKEEDVLDLVLPTEELYNIVQSVEKWYSGLEALPT